MTFKIIVSNRNVSYDVRSIYVASRRHDVTSVLHGVCGVDAALTQAGKNAHVSLVVVFPLKEAVTLIFITLRHAQQIQR